MLKAGDYGVILGSGLAKQLKPFMTEVTVISAATPNIIPKADSHETKRRKPINTNGKIT